MIINKGIQTMKIEHCQKKKKKGLTVLSDRAFKNTDKL